MLLIYTHTITSRLSYTVHYLFTELYSIDVEVTSDKERYRTAGIPKLNYSGEKLLDQELFVPASTLLFEKNLVKHNPNISITDDKQPRFCLSRESSSVHDPFAGSFYLLSRYEEYLSFEPDNFDRFEANQSLLYPKWLYQPLVNTWAEEIIQQVLQRYPKLRIRRKQFTSIASFDIDQAYAYKHKSWLRKAVIRLRLYSPLYKSDKSVLSQVIRQKREDHYDTFNFLQQTSSKTEVPFIFFLNAGKRSRFDKNIRVSHPVMTTLLRSLKRWSDVGIHPSYYTLENPKLLAKELHELQLALQHDVTKSRQHYIRLRFPDTYRSLLEAGISEDYSMGYASMPGFRAGTCTPFNWFDLLKNEETKLRVFPFSFMEGTFAEDMQMKPEQAWVEMKKIIETVRFFNGTFIPIWHNHTLSDAGFWQGWKAVFERMITEISQR